MNYKFKSTDGISNTRFLLRIMPKFRRCFILLICIVMSQSFLTPISASNEMLSVNLQQATVGSVLSAIEKQSDYYFTYNSELIDVNRSVSINIKNKSIESILKDLFAGENVRYKIVGKNVVLYKSLPAQQNGKRKVTGVVKDSGGPIIGANIIEKGTHNGTITDTEGRFSLEVGDNATLEISYIGYVPQNIKITNQKSLSVTMKEDSQTLDELVVVGYGTVKKSDLTGSVSSVKSDEITKMATNSPVAALQGRAAGVSVSLGSGSPDATASIQIRGVGTPNDSSPLYVVDGFPMSDINYLNPEDIESIEILKDASACAIYGSRGANGVVVITTKKGKEGDLRVKFNAYYGIEHLASKPEMLDSKQYGDLVNETYANSGASPLYSNTSNLQNTDWYKEVTRLGRFQNYNVNLTGGGSKVQSVFSANYYRRDGMVKSTNYERITLNQNNVIKATSFLKFTTDLSVAMTTHKRLDPSSIFLSSLIAPPDVPVWDSSTNYYSGITRFRLGNPAGTIARNEGEYKRSFFIANFSADLNITKDLVYTSRFGLKVRNDNDKDFTPTFYETANISTLTNTVYRASERTTDWTWENMLTYHHNFADKHDLTAMAAMSARSYGNDSYSATKQGAPLESKEFWYFDSATNNPLASGDGAELSMLSYLGRLNYGFMNRYLITASIRADGSSRFTKNNRWGYFPSAALAWKLSEEKFFKNWNQNWLNSVKLRAGYGEIGNENIYSYYPYLTPIAQQQYYTLGSSQSRINGAAPSAIGNSDAKWETSKQLNFGVDLSFLNSALTITADYYIRKTDDILLSQQIPNTSGFSTTIRNVGGMKNNGFEFTAGYKGGKGDFTYNINGNFALVRNKVTDLGTSSALVSNIPYLGNLIDLQGALGNMIRSVVGKPYGQFYGYVTDGIFQNQNEIDAYKKDGALIQPDAKPGDFKFKDVNNNGKIDTGDMDFIGNPIPDVTFGLSFDANYKKFDFSCLFQGVAGNDIYNAAKYYFMRFDGRQNVRTDYLKDYWHGEGTSNKIPIPTTDSSRNSRNFKNSDYYVEDGSYVRLKTIQLGYTFSPKLAEGVKPSVRVYISAQNLFTITGYSGFDPEVSNDISVDRGQYPQAQSFMLGTVINF